MKKFLTDEERITLVRKSKLGDIVCVEPIIRTLLENGIKVEFVTSKLGKELFSCYPKISVKTFHGKGSKVINLHSMESGEILDSGGLKIHRLNALWYGPITKIYELIIRNKLNLSGLKFNYQPMIHFRKKNILGLKNYVVVHRFSNDKSKNSESRYWNTIVKVLLKEGIPVVEIGGKDVADIKVEEFQDKNFIDLRGKLSLLEAAQVIDEAKLFIGIMSGPSHIANAVRTPGIIISKQYAHYDFHNPYPGFYEKQDKVSIFFYRKRIFEIPLKKVIGDIFKLLRGESLSMKFPNKYKLGIKRINDFIDESDKFIIWGAGSYGRSILKLLSNLSKKVVFFIDVDKAKEGLEIEGVKVFSPKKLMDISVKGNYKIIVSTLWWTDVVEFLERGLHLKRWIDYI